jgi:hypothetical protein
VELDRADPNLDYSLWFMTMPDHIGSQQDLCPLDLAHGLPTATVQGVQRAALAFAQVHEKAYSNPDILNAQSIDNSKAIAM